MFFLMVDQFEPVRVKVMKCVGLALLMAHPYLATFLGQHQEQSFLSHRSLTTSPVLVSTVVHLLWGHPPLLP